MSDPEVSMTRYRSAAARALAYLRGHLQADGSYGPQITDLASYYKSPYLYLIAGELEECHHLLSYIGRQFLGTDGDLRSSPALKSGNDAYDFYTMYPNTWVALAAQKTGRFEIAQPACQHLRGYRDTATGGFRGGRADGPAGTAVDLIATSAMTLLGLYFGDLDQSRACARVLRRFLERQPDPAGGFLLRMRPDGELIDDYPAELAPYYLLDARRPEQWYFMVGYPLAVLALLHRATGDPELLTAARGYFDFAAGCTGVQEFFFSHKVGWGAGLLYAITGEERYAQFAAGVCDHLVRMQAGDGRWLADMTPVFSFDQTAECAIWLREISALLGAAPPRVS